ncbi:MAG: transcription antitermination factor NusB [Anaerolineales bacterium]|nr:transcription antitermination factor NusB [Anaerolineales bacterium]
MKRERRKARTLALQTLYEVDSVGHAAEAVIARHIDENSALGDEGVAFFRQLVLGTLQLSGALDRLIAESAPEWPVNELAVIERNILRLAIWEFAVSGQTPLKVAINEAVELAKLFGSDSAPRFVNGVLGTLADREDEIRRQVSLLVQD